MEVKSVINEDMSVTRDGENPATGIITVKGLRSEVEKYINHIMSVGKQRTTGKAHK